MSYDEDLLFPQQLLAKRLRSTGNLWGWKFDDIPDAIDECSKVRLAILGGHAEFFLPDGTCELFWLTVDPKPRKRWESWNKYVSRSCNEFLSGFHALVKNTDFNKEAMEWEFLKKKLEAGINIFEYLCFELHETSESSYSESHMRRFCKRRER